MNNWTIVSYYTTATYYEKVAQDYLIKSCHALNLPYEIVGVPNLGDWNKNTHYKATFIRYMLDVCQDVVFVDCDAKFLQYPTLFDTLKCDLAAYIWHRKLMGDNDRHELLSGTMYFANNPRVKQFVDKWILALGKTGLWEQKVLQETLKKEGADLSFVELPPEYCKIFDLHVKVANPVVEHYQKSRHYRKTRSLN